jgi:chromosome partitioning protein
MKILVVASQKGGAGKTTIAAHLAVMAESAGHGPVAMIDTDPQASLAKWWNKREAPTPIFSVATVQGLRGHLDKLAEAGFKLAIIDTPPAVTTTISAVIAEADLVLIPTRPSPLDLEAVGATVEIAEAAGRRMVFVINGAANRARITGEAAIALSQHGTVAPVTLYQRTDFASGMIDGRTAQEIDPDSKAADEVGKLWQYVSTHVLKDARKDGGK